MKFKTKFAVIGMAAFLLAMVSLYFMSFKVAMAEVPILCAYIMIGISHTSLGWKVPFREVYCERFRDWVGEVIHCHLVLRLFGRPRGIDPHGPKAVIAVLVAAFLSIALGAGASDYTMPETYTSDPGSAVHWAVWNHNHPEFGSFSQSTGGSNGVTGTTSSGNNLLDLGWQGLKYLLGSTNWGAGAIAGHSVNKNYWLAGFWLTYNVTPVFAPIFAVDERFNSKTHVFSSVSGGVSLQLPLQPFTAFGVTNFWATPYAGVLAANGSGGNVLGEINEAGIDFALVNFGTAFSLHAGVDYQNCQGQGVYSANYLAGHLAISRALPEGIAFAHRETIWQRIGYAIHPARLRIL